MPDSDSIKRGPRLRHGHARAGKRTPTYRSWRAMNDRCSRPTNIGWHIYGGRGIKVCKRWRKFDNFLADMGERPKGLTLERKKSEKNYEPNNCIWASQKAQQNNRSNNRLITAFSKTQTLQQWADELGCRRKLISDRIKRGWSVEKALTTKSRKEAPKTHCKHGHLLSGDNLYLYDGRRYCRTCKRRHCLDRQKRLRANKAHQS